MTYDVARDRVVLIGYNDLAPGGASTDIWEWDGVQWERIPSGSLSALSGRYHLVYDPTKRVSILLEESYGSIQGLMFEWDGTARTQKSGPAVGIQYAVSFDASRGELIRFGGSLDSGFQNDTWKYDGTSWIRLSLSASPPPRHSHSMAYDAKRGNIVLFGGRSDPFTNSRLADTWIWDGVDWKERHPRHAPPARSGHQLVYDSNRKRVILFGGRSQSGVSLEDTWEWDGQDWVEQTTLGAPPARLQFAMAYDSAREQVICFGGLAADNTLVFSDTWTYQFIPIEGAASQFGTGCPGTAGTPTLSAAPGNLPWISEEFEVELASLPASFLATPFLMIGFSNTRAGIFPLPLELSWLGMPGCNLLMSAELLRYLSNQLGTTRWATRFPNEPAFVGVTVYLQGFIIDRGANDFGATLTNGLEIRVGAR